MELLYDTIYYLYDASGIKLDKIVTGVGIEESTWYVGEIIYDDSNIDYILTLHQALFSRIFKSVSKMLLKHTNWWLIITKINGRYSKNNYLGFFRNL